MTVTSDVMVGARRCPDGGPWSVTGAAVGIRRVREDGSVVRPCWSDGATPGEPATYQVDARTEVEALAAVFVRRILAKCVDRSGGETGCWPWTGNRDSKNYGRFNFLRRQFFGHRAAYELEHGRLADGLCALHRCDNPPCCNPAHLFAGTKMDNNADRVAKGRTVSGSSKLNAELVREIRSRAAAGESGASIFRALAKRVGLTSKQTVNNVLSGKTWRDVK